jgi:hypothetical protein
MLGQRSFILLWAKCADTFTIEDKGKRKNEYE